MTPVIAGQSGKVIIESEVTRKRTIRTATRIPANDGIENSGSRKYAREGSL
jgi:hypothetical protein